MLAYQIFSALAPELAYRVLDDVQGADKELYRAALQAAAQVRRVRPVFLERQPRPERNKIVHAALGRPDLNVVTTNVLSGWLIHTQNGMVCDFLDQLGIPHEKGVVEDLPPGVPDGALNTAVSALLAKYPAEVVTLYLQAFHGLNQTNWANLETLLKTDPRLQLNSAAK